LLKPGKVVAGEPTEILGLLIVFGAAGTGTDGVGAAGAATGKSDGRGGTSAARMLLKEIRANPI
jgi:hypothetical protein